jgi:hypothetical protein
MCQLGSLFEYATCALSLFSFGNKTVPTTDLGTFENPAARSRVRFRYWVPDGGVDPAVVAEDVASAGSVGAGGFEFLPFFEYGGQLGLGVFPQTIDWCTHNFGSVSFRNLFKTALEAHRDNGLVMDFALGPNQGQGVPANKDDEGLHWDLVRTNPSRPWPLTLLKI